MTNSHSLICKSYNDSKGGSEKCGAIQQTGPIPWSKGLTMKTVTWVSYFTDWLIQFITSHSFCLVWEDSIFVLIHASELFTALNNLDSIWAIQITSDSFWHWLFQCSMAQANITIAECKLCQVLKTSDKRYETFTQELSNAWAVNDLVHRSLQTIKSYAKHLLSNTMMAWTGLWSGRKLSTL